MEVAQFHATTSKATQLYKTTKERLAHPVLGLLGKNRLEKEAYGNFTQAIQLYYNALEHSRSDEQRISVYWNIGMASFSALSLASKDQAMFHCGQAVDSFFKTLNLGTKLGRDPAWLIKVMGKIDATITSATDDTKLRVAQYERGKNLKSFHVAHQAAVNFKIASVYVGVALALQEKGQWRESIPLFNLALSLTEKALKERSNYMCADTLEIKQTIEVHLTIAISQGFLVNADQELQRQLHVEETISMPMMWIILDMYFHAMVSTREKNIEIEAIAASGIGRMYHKIFKQETKAHTFYSTSYKLAMLLQPRNMSTHDWFKEALSFLQYYQETKVRDEDAKDSEWKKPIKLQLQKELEAITDASKGTPDAFLAFLYKVHPPKGDPAPTIPSQGTLKLRLRQAVVTFHPDKQKLYDNSKTWYVLCEEITKILNGKYQCMKSEDSKEDTKNEENNNNNNSNRNNNDGNNDGNNNGNNNNGNNNGNNSGNTGNNRNNGNNNGNNNSNRTNKRHAKKRK